MSLANFVHDPVIVHAAAAAVGIILIGGALAKLRDIELFRYAVDNYGLLDAAGAALFARVFPLFELAAGVALVLDISRPVGVLLALLVLAVATGGVALALLRGAGRIECGCGAGNQRISWGLVGRNACLTGIAILAAAEELPRGLGPVDYISVAGAILALLVVYAAANQLLANQPLLKELQS